MLLKIIHYVLNLVRNVELYKFTAEDLGFDLYSRNKSDPVEDNHLAPKSSTGHSGSLEDMDLFGGDLK